MENHKENVPFWVVWNPKGGASTVMHSNQRKAECEALRLAREAPGQEFFVLQPVLRAKKTEVEVTRFGPDKDDEIRF